MSREEFEALRRVVEDLRKQLAERPVAKPHYSIREATMRLRKRRTAINDAIAKGLIRTVPGPGGTDVITAVELERVEREGYVRSRKKEGPKVSSGPLHPSVVRQQRAAAYAERLSGIGSGAATSSRSGS